MRTLLYSPLGLALLVGLLALALLVAPRLLRGARERLGGSLRRAGLALLILAWGLPLFASLPRVGLAALESWSRYGLALPEPAWLGAERAEAIVVLAGGLDGAARAEVPLSFESTERVVAAVALARLHPDARVLFSGGSSGGGPSSALRMAEEAEALGLEPARILLEERARTTRGNARECAALLDELGASRVLLVTSPVHARRAREAFLALGVEAGYLWHEDLRRASGGLVPDVRALFYATRVTHEALGLFVYRARGWATSAPLAEQEKNARP